ncbi:four helix bundle protein [Chryseobacterium sp. PBS4-4]|uniref:Four helix bundle protein n=1 Tax=Chryseobacterium edaphi TaxID=2976532 RepID=A0ABT2WA32_9FLAO|nr:four helix bundle protein [Chryseobacterium edaphi]MCU7619044.1 four helix bundle protein [Chryseobacterium edaphi]
MAHFKELLVWQKSINFVTEIYKETESFPKTEMYGLTSQIRRATVSIPSNIAEGNSRRSVLDYLQFLRISRGSCAEVETQLIISKNLGFLDEDKSLKLNQDIIEISKMLNGLITSLMQSTNLPPKI